MRIEDAIVMREEHDGHLLAESMFRRRYRQSPPDFPHHVLAYARPEGHDGLRPVAYLHCTDLGGIMLGGGVCVDDRVLRKLPARERQAIHAAGGLYRHALQWSIEHFRSRTKAIFGYCGDPLAERVDIAAGFGRTRYRHLLAFFTRDLPEDERQLLVERANRVGPF